jgi:uncharacterized ferritin-like protein (DUF455 family)
LLPPGIVKLGIDNDRKSQSKAAVLPRPQTIRRKSRHASARGGFLLHALRFLELALVLVRLDHVASFIVNANRSTY